MARSLRTRRTHSLGLVVTELANPFFATIAGAVEAEASAAGYTVMVAATGEDADRQIAYLRELQARPADGLIVAPGQGGEVLGALQSLVAAGVPLVTIDRRIEEVRCDRVLCDSRRAAAELVAVLAGMGCRRLAMASGPDGLWTADQRLAGFRQGLATAGLPLPAGMAAAGPFSVEHGRTAAAAFLDAPEPPDGIVAANNRILAGVLEELSTRGQAAAGVAVAGFDGVPYAPFLGRPIAVAEQPEDQIGRTAARALIERIQGLKDPPRELMLPIAIKTFRPPPDGR